VYVTEMKTTMHSASAAQMDINCTSRPATLNKNLAVASIARDVGSSSTNRSSDIMH